MRLSEVQGINPQQAVIDVFDPEAADATPQKKSLKLSDVQPQTTMKLSSVTMPKMKLSEVQPSAVEQIGARQKRFQDEGTGTIKKALTEPLSEKGNPIARIGEVGGRVADVAGGAFQTVLSPFAATAGQVLKPLAQPLARGVARVQGATPEQAQEIGKKLEGSTADVLGGSVANAGAIAAGGMKAPEKSVAKTPPVIEKPDLAPGVKSAQKIDSAAIKSKDGQIYTGPSHAAIREAHKDVLGKSGEEGFVTNTREFVPRNKALGIATTARQLLQQPVEKGKLHSEDIGRPVPQAQSKIFSPDQPIASTKNIATPEGVADKLYQSRGAVRADYKEFSKWAAPFKNVPKAFWQKALDHLDDPKGTPLSPEEKIIFDRSIGTMRDEIDANRKEIKASGFDPKYLDEESGSLGGAIRVRKGMDTPLDKMTNTKSRAPESGRSLSRSAGTFKGRNMMALVKDGKRQVVHIDREGNIFDASKKGDPVGQMTESGQPDSGKLVEATRKEIEQATGGQVQYHDNAFGVYATSLLETRRAIRSMRILNDIKKSPEFNQVAHAPYTKGEIPKGWKEIDYPAFRGYRFEPRYAEEIEDFIHGIKRDAGSLNALDKVNRFTLNLLFWLNPIHAYNITDAFLTTKGAGGLAKDLPGTTKDLFQSIKSVATRDKLNMEQARSGVPMPGLDTAGEEFRRMTLDVMGVKARQDPQGFLQFIKQWGYDNPKDFLARTAEVSHKAVFSWQDVLQQTLERGYMRQGLTRAQATEKAAKTFMNYRTPARVADQRWIGQALQGQAWLDFPKYSYGRLKGMYEMLKGTAKGDTHAIDQLLMIAMLYEFGRHVINPELKKLTSQDNAEFGNFGYGVFPELAERMADGQRTPGQAAQSLMSPGYLMQGIDMASGINRYMGKPLSIPGESAGEIGMDYASELANKLSPMQRMGQVASGQITPDDLWLQQLGVKFPGDPSSSRTVRKQLKSREKYGSKLEQELE